MITSNGWSRRPPDWLGFSEQANSASGDAGSGPSTTAACSASTRRNSFNALKKSRRAADSYRRARLASRDGSNNATSAAPARSCSIASRSSVSRCSLRSAIASSTRSTSRSRAQARRAGSSRPAPSWAASPWKLPQVALESASSRDPSTSRADSPPRFASLSRCWPVQVERARSSRSPAQAAISRSTPSGIRRSWRRAHRVSSARLSKSCSTRSARSSSNASAACRTRPAMAADSWVAPRSIRTESVASWRTRIAPIADCGANSAWRASSRRSTSSTSSLGMTTPWPVRPCLREFWRDRSLPSGVLGPQLLRLLARLAWVRASEEGMAGSFAIGWCVVDAPLVNKFTPIGVVRTHFRPGAEKGVRKPFFAARLFPLVA